MEGPRFLLFGVLGLGIAGENLENRARDGGLFGRVWVVVIALLESVNAHCAHVEAAEEIQELRGFEAGPDAA